MFDNDNPPTLKERIYDVNKLINCKDYINLKTHEIQDIINMIIYNTKVSSLSLYKDHTQKQIFLECKSTLKHYNKVNNLRRLHALSIISRFARLCIHNHYKPNGIGAKRIYFNVYKRSKTL